MTGFVVFITGLFVIALFTFLLVQDDSKRKHIAKLESELAETKSKLSRYTSLSNALAKLLGEAAELKKSVPEGCTPGEWCKACEFGKELYYGEYVDNCRYTNTLYICNKAASCPNFIQKKEN